MDQTTLPAASGALPWRSPRPQHKPLILFNRAGDAYVFWLESGSHCGKSPNIVSGWMMGVESNLSTEDRFAAVAPSPTLICSDGDIFIGNISGLSRNDGRDRLHNAMHDLEMPCRVQPPVCCPARNIGAHNPSTRIWDSTARPKLHQDI